MATVQFNRQQYAANFKALHAGYERKSYKVFKKALNEQVAPVIAHVKRYGGIDGDVADMLVKKSPMEAAYKEVYETIGTRHAAYTYKQINSLGRSAKSVSFFSDAWRRLMNLFYTNSAADRVSDVTDTTRERIRKILDDADEQGLTTSEKADYIVEQLDDPAFNRQRALVIARTESTTAANKGASIGNEDADYETVKQWLAIEDAVTRPSHADADGQTVENTEYFIVGGESCQYPGDPILSAKESIQCRCTSVYLPKLSALGLPILK